MSNATRLHERGVGGPRWGKVDSTRSCKHTTACNIFTIKYSIFIRHYIFNVKICMMYYRYIYMMNDCDTTHFLDLNSIFLGGISVTFWHYRISRFENYNK